MKEITLLSKTFWTPKDLSIFSGVSLQTARKVFSDVNEKLKNKGKSTLSKSVLPTKEILDELNIDVDYVINMQKKLKE